MFTRDEICEGLYKAIEDCNKADLLGWIEELPVCYELKQELIDIVMIDNELAWNALKLVISVICQEDFVWNNEK